MGVEKLDGPLALLSQILDFAGQLLPGFGKTLAIFALTLVMSLPLGLLVAFGRMSRIAAIRLPVKLFISVMRGTPLMLQLMVVFYAPAYVFRISLGDLPFDYRFVAVIIAFVINYSAYFAEIYRGGIASIASGQYEAGAVLGFTRMQTFFDIILPQVVRTILPSVTNEVITLVKDTSLAQVLACAEMFTLASRVSSAESTILPFFVAGIFYYAANYVVQLGMEFVEKKLDYYKR